MRGALAKTATQLALDDAKMYARFLWGLRGYLRERISLEDARAIVRQRIAERDERFLRVAERGIYGHPPSPYRKLLKLAGCELGDLRQMVLDRGLEGALMALREAGVYVSFQEFKGRAPIVRGSTVIPVESRDFDNPFVRRAYESRTGGSTGAGTRVDMDLDHIAAGAGYASLTWDAHGYYPAPNALWYGTPPDGTGLGVVLARIRCGMPPAAWFTPLTSRDLRPALKYRLACWLTVNLSRAYGAPFARPRPLGVEDARVIAHWVHRALQRHGVCVVGALVSMCLRISAAAREEGIDLTGSALIGAGEPPTPAKVREITASGAHWIPLYGSAETGMLGIGCGRPLDGNDVHFVKDTYALIQHPRQVPGSDLTVQSLHFSNLLPTSPRMLLNAELDDFAVVESRACGCPLEAIGLTEHLREIYSFSKLTGEGVTLIGSDMLHILEAVLPARFGGSSQDYQLLEEEDDKGLTRLSLWISPRLAIADEREVVEVMHEALRRTNMGANVARAIWSQAGTLRVVRREPIWTARGKFLPLRLAQRAAAPGSATEAGD